MALNVNFNKSLRNFHIIYIQNKYLLFDLFEMYIFVIEYSLLQVSLDRLGCLNKISLLILIESKI